MTLQLDPYESCRVFTNKYGFRMPRVISRSTSNEASLSTSNNKCETERQKIGKFGRGILYKSRRLLRFSGTSD